MKPFLSNDLINRLNVERTPEEDESYRHVGLVEDALRSWLKDAQIEPEALRGKTRVEVSQLLDGYFERFAELMTLRKRIMTQVQATLLKWHGGLSLEKALCALQRAVEKDPLHGSGPDDVLECIDGRFIEEIFERFDRSREAFGWPEASDFRLNKTNILLLVDHGILTPEDFQGLVMIHTTMTLDVALSEPAPLNRKIRTLSSLFRAIEDGVFDEELRPAFQEMRRVEPQVRSDEDARGVFVGCTGHLLAEISQGEDIASGLELVTVLARLSVHGHRRLQQEKEGHLEPGTVSKGEIIVCRFLLPIIERIRKHLQESRLEDDRFLQRLRTAPLGQAEMMLEDILDEGETDQEAEGKVA